MSGTEHGEAHAKCLTTTDIGGALRCGSGKCDHNGFWEIECHECTARANIHWAQVCERERDSLRETHLCTVQAMRSQIGAAGSELSALRQALEVAENERDSFKDALITSKIVREDTEAERDAIRASLASALESLRGMRGMLALAQNHMKCDIACTRGNGCQCGGVAVFDRITAAITATSGGEHSNAK